MNNKQIQIITVKNIRTMKTKLNLLNAAKNADYVFISVMGPHAQEKEDEIFRRKTDDIKGYGESYWVSGINEKFITRCREKLNGKSGYVILVESKSAVDTKNSQSATQYSEDNVNWKDIEAGISPVSGKFPNKAYCFDDIEYCEDIADNIDLDYYEDTIKLGAIKFWLGYSNVFAKKSAIRMSGGMKSHERKIVGILRLKYPYVLWVK